MKKQLTLCIVCDDGKVLLGMKKRGFGAGRWNGFGGKVEDGETLDEAAAREMKEEANIVPVAFNKVGILHFTFKDDAQDELEVHVYKVDEFAGEPEETEEMFPEWFAYDEIPYGQMWSDDEHWLPFLLTRKLFKGRFLFDRPADENHAAQILEFEMDAVASLEED